MRIALSVLLRKAVISLQFVPSSMKQVLEVLILCFIPAMKFFLALILMIFGRLKRQLGKEMKEL